MKKSLIIAAIVSVPIACDSESVSTTDLVLRAPDRSIQAITTSQFELEVLIDDVPYTLQSTGAVWRRSLSLPTDRELPLSVRWFYGQLPVASYETTIGPLSELDSAVLTVTPGDYVSTGSNYDADADGISNLQELFDCTDPESSSNVTVRIPRIPDGTSVGINGSTGVVWEENSVIDLCGNRPMIDNLMIDKGAVHPDGQTGFYWQAVHNSEFLYIIVFAEDVSTSTPFADSSIFGRDDAINIFIDGDNSKLTNYDGVNDFHITIPMFKRSAPATESRDLLLLDNNGDLTFDNQGGIAIRNEVGDTVFVTAGAIQANNAGVDDGRIAFGPLSERLDDNLDFANGIPGSGRQVYEVSIALDALDIAIDQPFGFDIQIDDDVDGGDKNARYGWKHPSRLPGGPDVNNTVNNPGFMGTVILE